MKYFIDIMQAVRDLTPATGTLYDRPSTSEVPPNNATVWSGDRMKLENITLVVDERQPPNLFTLVGQNEAGELVSVLVKNVTYEVVREELVARPEP